MIWLPTHQVFKRGDHAMSLGDCLGLYRIYNDEGILLYVGKAERIRNRVSMHFKGKSENTKEVSHEFSKALITYLRHKDARVNIYENMLIYYLKPKYNKELRKDPQDFIESYEERRKIWNHYPRLDDFGKF